MSSRYLYIFSICSLLLIGCFRNVPSQTTLTNEDSDHKSERFEKHTFRLESIEDLRQFLTYNEKRYPLVSAHRGGPIDGYPENAIETFAYWTEKTPIIIECDVRMSKDSVLVMMHDETLDRTTNGEGKVISKTLSELKNLKLRDNNGKLTKFQIPTLDEVLQWGHGKAIFTLDVKQDVPYKLLSQAISRNHAHANSVVITYNAKQAKALYQTDPDVMISVSVKSQKDLNKLAEYGIPDNKLVAFVGTSQPKTELVELLHAHGIQVILGTIGNLDRQADSRGYQVYADFIENGADILSTDRPSEAQKALDFYIRKRNITSTFINN